MRYVTIKWFKTLLNAYHITWGCPRQPTAVVTKRLNPLTVVALAIRVEFLILNSFSMSRVKPLWMSLCPYDRTSSTFAIPI